VAVVGAVKAGKSTLINALVGQDLLKRGAGILTAMITRVQSGPQPRARLTFKEWGAIQDDLKRVLGLLPSATLGQRSAPFNLRLAEDRKALAQVLGEGQAAGTWSQNHLSEDYLLLQSYLQGYPEVATFLAAGPDLILDGGALSRHHDLVTREATAVFLKDVLLSLPTPWLARGVELGDCQGSDSPLPQHLAQVLAFLLKTDLALYVISSRVGLRQADFQFLGELNKMGLTPHLLVILNLDLTELREAGEITRQLERLRAEIAPVLPEAPVYAFSALQLLLERRREQGEALSAREASLLNLWLADASAAAFSAAEARRFAGEFQIALEHLKTRRLEGGSLSQVQTVARGLREQLELTQNLLGQDLSAVQDVARRLQDRREPLRAARQSLQQTLEGAAATLKKHIKDRVSSFLDPSSGQGASLLGFIRDYEPDWEHLLPLENPPPFRVVLYHLFQAFQGELSRYTTQELNLQLLDFARAQADRLRRELEQACAPLSQSLEEALTLYYREIAALGVAAAAPHLDVTLPPPPPELELPLLTVLVDPGWRWAGEVWMRSGMGVMKRAWEGVKKRLALKGETDHRSQELQDLKHALVSLKKWLREEVRLLLLDCSERLKFRYFLPLVDYWVARQGANLDDLLGSLLTDLKGVAEALNQKEEDRAARGRRLEELLPRARVIEAGLVIPTRDRTREGGG